MRLIEINAINCFRINVILFISCPRAVPMFTWLDKITLEWIIFVVLVILILGCFIWRMSFGARDERVSRKD
jgi:hypothetical protein